MFFVHSEHDANTPRITRGLIRMNHRTQSYPRTAKGLPGGSRLLAVMLVVYRLTRATCRRPTSLFISVLLARSFTLVRLGLPSRAGWLVHVSTNDFNRPI